MAFKLRNLSRSFYFRLAQTISVILATILLATGGRCWMADGNLNCDAQVNRAILEWPNFGMSGLYVQLAISITLSLVVLITLFDVYRGKTETFHPQGCGAFWCIYFGAFTCWFSIGYTTLDGGYSPEWAASAAFYILAFCLFWIDLLIDARINCKGKKKDKDSLKIRGKKIIAINIRWSQMQYSTIICDRQLRWLQSISSYADQFYKEAESED